MQTELFSSEPQRHGRVRSSAPKGGWNRAWRWRGVVQAGCLALFLYLTWASSRSWPGGGFHDLFVRLDPLVWLLNSIGSRQFARHAGMALALLAGTAAMGRVFCGWICPLGTVLDAVGRLQRRRAKAPALGRWTRLRFWLLGGMLGAAWMKINLAGWADPIVLSSRAVRQLVAPRVGIRATVWTTALLAGIIGATYVRRRWWCRAMCPLGALLSLPAHFARYRRRRGANCVECAVCRAACPMEVANQTWAMNDCLVCHRCQQVCNRDGVRFSWAVGGDFASPTFETGPSSETGRRKILAVLGGWLVGEALGLGLRFADRERPPGPLRPPGVADEREFLARCIGCGACWTVCPTRALGPCMRGDCPDALFTPEFRPRVGPCVPECTACGEVCPTQAIPRLSLENKHRARIGVAVIDPQRCLPWSKQERCVICADACPSMWRAIALRRDGPGPFWPHVEADRCTGCGACEHRCPVEGGAAIRVVPLHPRVDART